MKIEWTFMIIYLLHEGLSMYRMFVFREAFKGYIKVKILFRTYASCKREFQTLLTFFACHRLWTYMAYNTKSTVGANGFKFSCTCNSCPDSCLNNGKLCIPSALLPGCPIVMEGESVHLFQLVLFILKKNKQPKSPQIQLSLISLCSYHSYLKTSHSLQIADVQHHVGCTKDVQLIW